MNKKGFTLIELLAVISILALIAMVVFPSVNSSIKQSKEKAYKEQIKIIENAAKQWALDHTDSLPSETGGESDINVSRLKEDGYITDDDVKDPRTGDEIEGKVVITYSSNQYLYKYEEKSEEIKAGEWILENATDKSILEANNRVYKGEDANNNINFSNKSFKIININSDDSIKIVMTEIIGSLPFDNNGSSVFSKSSIYNYLNNTFKNELDTSKLTNFAVCTGSVDNTCKNKVSTMVSLLSIDDYVNASNKINCSSSNNLCGTGTYLKNLNNVCLTNKKDNQIYVVNDGSITLKNPNENCNILPVITLKSSVTLSGSGTISAPFIVN